jgi:glutaminyl-peptide cyclotransferase
MKIIVFLVLIFGLISCDESTKKTNDPEFMDNTRSSIKRLEFNLKSIHPHDTTSFTEGLLIFENKIYESTGSPIELPNTRSIFGVVDSLSGKIKTPVEIDRKKYFGEGITILNGKVFQLTYKNQIGFVYDFNTKKKMKTFNYSNLEGWGITNDSTNLIMSDGTSTITFLNPEKFNIVKQIIVSENNQKINNLNELEYVDGFLYANIFTTTEIVKIDPNTGNVIGRLNLDKLLNDALRENPNSLEMNGIAYSPTSKHFFITGKMWPFIYEIEVN